MPPMSSRWFALLSAVVLAQAATRPHYGGTLRVEVEASIETADPPHTGPGMADLSGAFSVTRWEGGRAAVYSANEDAPGGRPFLDSVEIQMGRPLREQTIDLELKKVDVVELGPNETRRGPASRKVWTSAPVRLLALVFSARISDARMREALALAVDRSAIHDVLLQRQGEIAGGLLPQWISGYSFLFPTSADTARARGLTAALPPQLHALTLSFEVPALRPIAERIALNARDAGLAVSVGQRNAGADVRLVEERIADGQPSRALSSLAAVLSLPQPARADSPEELYAAERVLLDGFRVIPLFHLPDTYGVNPRVKGGSGITPLGQWRFTDLWLDTVRP
jgi:peptide/nickel transport system substrate-binding protein